LPDQGITHTLALSATSGSADGDKIYELFQTHNNDRPSIQEHKGVADLTESYWVRGIGTDEIINGLETTSFQI
jgi:hypothetical protein